MTLATNLPLEDLPSELRRCSISGRRINGTKTTSLVQTTLLADVSTVEPQLTPGNSQQRFSHDFPASAGAPEDSIQDFAFAMVLLARPKHLRFDVICLLKRFLQPPHCRGRAGRYVILSMSNCSSTLFWMPKTVRMADSPFEAQAFEVQPQGLLPALRCIASAVKAKFEFPQ